MSKKETKDTYQKPLTPTMEDYLEAIYNLGNEKRVVRVKNIAKRLEVKMPTVTNMLKVLSKEGLIDYEKYEYLELTDKGVDVGREICRRHQVFRSFLTDILKVDYKKANEEACKMEHAVSPSTMDRLIEFMEFTQSCPRTGSSWLDNFDEYRLRGQKPDKCLDRMKEFANKFEESIKTMEKVEAKTNGAQ